MIFLQLPDRTLRFIATSGMAPFPIFGYSEASCPSGNQVESSSALQRLTACFFQPSFHSLEADLEEKVSEKFCSTSLPKGFTEPE
jgi:hypothetical protein